MDIITYALCKRYTDKVVKESAANGSGGTILPFTAEYDVNDDGYVVTSAPENVADSIDGGMMAAHVTIMENGEAYGDLFLPLSETYSYPDSYTDYEEVQVGHTSHFFGEEYQGASYTWETPLYQAAHDAGYGGYHISGSVWMEEGSAGHTQAEWDIDEYFELPEDPQQAVVFRWADYEILITDTGVSIEFQPDAPPCWDLTLTGGIEKQIESTEGGILFTGYSDGYGAHCVLKGEYRRGNEVWSFYMPQGNGNSLPDASGVSF